MHFGTEWYGDYGVAQSDLKKGDRIYVQVEIRSMYQMAFHLAVKHTKEEIGRLYSRAAGQSVGGIALQEIFKMDKAAMKVNNITYDGNHSKQ